MLHLPIYHTTAITWPNCPHLGGINNILHLRNTVLVAILLFAIGNIISSGTIGLVMLILRRTVPKSYPTSSVAILCLRATVDPNLLLPFPWPE
jgi:hypothetical protein